MCGAQLSGRQALGRARLGGGQGGRALPSCTPTCGHRADTHVSDSQKPRHAGVTTMTITKPSSKSRRQSIQAEAVPPSRPAPVDRFYSTRPAARTPRTPVPPGDPGPPSSCLPFAFPSNTLFGHLASQHLSLSGGPHSHSPTETPGSAVQQTGLPELKPHTAHSLQDTTTHRQRPGADQAVPVLTDHPARWRATYKFEHVPIKHIVIGETLAMEQVPEELSQV